MTRTCGTCERTWDGTATFCGACGDLLDTSLGRRRPPRTRPAWLHPWVLVVLTVGFVAGVVATVPTLSIATDRGVDGQIGLPDDPEDLPAGTSASPPRPGVPRPDANPVTCRTSEDCVVWHRQVGGVDGRSGFFAPPRAVGDTVLTFDEHTVAAYDIADGERRWRRSYGSGEGVHPLGLENGHALLSTEAGSVWLIDLDTGDTVWRAPAGLPLHGDIFVGDLVLTGGPLGDDESMVRALDVATGEPAWEWTAPWPGAHVTAADEEVVVVEGWDGGRAELDPLTGQARTVTPAAVVDHRAMLMATRGDLAVVAYWELDPSDGSPRGTEPRIEVIEVHDGSVRWTQPTTDGVPVVVIDDLVILTAPVDDAPTGMLRGRDLATGEVRWERETAADSSVGSNQFAVLGSRRSGPSALVMVETGTVRRLDPATGETLWEADLSRQWSGWPSVSDDMVVVESGSGGVALFDLATGEERLAIESGGGWLVNVDPPVVYDIETGILTVLRIP